MSNGVRSGGLVVDGAAQGVVELGGVVGFEVVGLPVGLEGRFE